MKVQRIAVRTAVLLTLSILLMAPAWGQPGGRNASGRSQAPQGEPGGPGGPRGLPKGMSPGGGPGARAKVTYKPAIYIENGAYLRNKSVSKALSGGTVNSTSASGVVITSKADSFNGIYVKGKNSVYTLSNATIDLHGNGVNHEDNYGVGAGAVVGGSGTLILKNVRIVTNGLSSCAATSTDRGTLKVYDSTLIANGGVLPPGSAPLGSGPSAWGPPAALGIGGTARATNATDGAKSYYYNSTIISKGWGALSTDETGGGVYVEADNCDIRTIENGYGTYADGGAKVVINNSRMATASYLGIVAGAGEIDLNGVDGRSKGNGVMLHNVGGNPSTKGILEINGGNIVTQKPVLLIKSASPDITVDGAKLASKSGILIESVINSDANAAKVNGQKVRSITITLKKMNLKGDILRKDTQRAMSVALMDTTLKGTIEGASLSLNAESKWTATGNSKVTLAGNVGVARIDAPAGVTITAFSGKGCTLKGRYKLASGGELNVKAN